MASKIARVALIGTKFMGKAHSNAWSKVGMFFDVPVKPVLQVLVGRSKADTEAAAERYGFAEWSTNWRKVVERDDIDVVDVSAPSNMHHDMVLAAARAGKHIVCEKPLAMSVSEAQEMVAAVRKAKVRNMCGFSYRFAPAIATIHDLVKKGTLGEIYHFRGAYQQDWIVDPAFPLNWRLQKKVSGSGSLGDIAAHTIYLCQYLVGALDEVAAAMQTFIRKRPLIEGSATIAAHQTVAKPAKMGTVDVDDAVSILGRIKGAETMVTIEATRFATGRRNGNSFEIYGSQGSVKWDMEDMNYFQYYNHGDPGALQGFRRVHATDPVHPYASAWWPAAHIIGYEHLFVHEMYEFLKSLATDECNYPTLEDGLAVQRVLATVAKAAKSRKWEKVR